jgi:hypothetical protein
MTMQSFQTLNGTRFGGGFLLPFLAGAAISPLFGGFGRGCCGGFYPPYFGGGIPPYFPGAYGGYGAYPSIYPQITPIPQPIPYPIPYPYPTPTQTVVPVAEPAPAYSTTAISQPFPSTFGATPLAATTPYSPFGTQIVRSTYIEG